MSNNPFNKISLHSVISSIPRLLVISMLSFFPLYATATQITSSSTIAAARDAQGVDSWWFSSPDATDTISYTSGLNVTDNVQHAKQSYGPEGKFNTGAGAPTARNFTGFTDNDGPGPQGSTTKTYSWGHSSVTKNVGVFGNVYYADWTVGAEGKKGTGAFPSWSSTASATDPWTYGSSDFADWGISASDTSFDLFFSVGLDSVEFSSVGDMHLSVFYQTVDQTLDLLDIGIDSNGNVSVNSGINGSGLTFYQQSSLQEGPLEDATTIIDTNGIKKLLEDDWADNNHIDNSLYLGLLLDDLSNPLLGTSFTDGSFARVLVNTDVSASVPTPGALFLVATGMGLMRIMRRRGIQR